MENRENNRLIATFMGWEASPYHNTPNKMYKGDIGLSLDGFQYRESWDSLFPVIDRINSMGKEYHFAIFKTYASMSVEKGGKMYKDFHFAHAEYITETQSSKEAVYKLIVKFIQWYGNALILEKHLKLKEDGNAIR